MSSTAAGHHDSASQQGAQERPLLPCDAPPLPVFCPRYEQRHDTTPQGSQGFVCPASSKGNAAKKPDMKAFAARASARLKAWYGDRVVADSGPLLDELRKDASA